MVFRPGRIPKLPFRRSNFDQGDKETWLIITSVDQIFSNQIRILNVTFPSAKISIVDPGFTFPIVKGFPLINCNPTGLAFTPFNQNIGLIQRSS